MGELVEYPGAGDTTAGYLATGEGAGPGVIVVHEWWGLVEHPRRVCDRLAAEGFTTLAPDLYHGRSAPVGNPDDAQEAMAALDLQRAAADPSGAVDHLQDHPAVRGRGVGVVGFGMGGRLALWLASTRPDRVRAVVPFYAFAPRDELQPDYGAITAAVEGHYAGDDELAGPEAVRGLEEVLDDPPRDVRMFVYPGTSHGFFDDTRPEAYDEDAARQAWVRTLEFLRATLG